MTTSFHQPAAHSGDRDYIFSSPRPAEDASRNSRFGRRAEGRKAKPFVESCRAFILGVDDDGQHRQRFRGAENAAYRIHRQHFTEALATHPNVPCKASDQRRWITALVARRLARDFLRQFAQLQLEGAQAVKPTTPNSESAATKTRATSRRSS
ncbi:hypothetical protein [Caballeronia sp. CLC5]|uniref:hypothetical protein n=1 Tax=Caballeronia sp. CLC5 TaxID=2906764 RepID=UPI001F1F6C2B|nr:hypothetical protein [Caballeronia sp. CLC5]MCE4570145.1 hypothetical protein [Caballeronia sp. CLC5]